MTIHKLRAAFATLVFLAAFAAGAGYWFHSLDAMARSLRASLPASRGHRRLGRSSAPPTRLDLPTRSPGRGPDVRRRPRARPARQAGAERDGRHLPAAQAPVRQPRFRGVLSGAGRPWGERRVGPVPVRCGPRVVGPSRAVRRHRAGARLRRRLGRPRPRRGPAVGRDPAHARASHRGPPLRRAGPARPGRGGLGLGDLAHPRTDRARAGSGHREPPGRTTTSGGAASTTGRAGRSRRRPTPTAASRCTASAAACTPG